VSGLSLVVQYLVNTLYRPLVVLLLVMMSAACVPAPDSPAPSARRPAPASGWPPVVRNPPARTPPVTVRPPVIRAPTPAQPPMVNGSQNWPQNGPMTEGRARPPAALVETIKTLGMNFPGRVGIAVTRVDGNWIVDHQGTQLFPQHSVSKTWVGLTLADAVDKGQIRFSDTVRITKSDLTLFHQPIKQLVGDDGYETTMSDLFHRAMTESDNTANDTILRRVGGPAAVRSFIASKGLGDIRFGPGERLFQSAIAGLTWQQDYSQGNAFENARNALSADARGQAMIRYLNDPMDGAAPNAIVLALAKLRRGELLSPSMTQLFLQTMESSKTGKQRVKGGVPFGWTYGHKTGTGQVLEGLVTGYNDVGILTAPDGTSYALAVLIRSTRQGIRERQALMQAVAAAIVANHQR
jgi:beta-lactamase class A